MINKNKGLTLIAAIALLAGLQPAFAQQTYTPAQTLVADQQGIKVNFNNRIAQINKQITDSVANRTITAAQAGGLQSGLNQISAEIDYNFMSDGGFTHDELTGLVAKLGAYAQQVTSSIQTNGNTIGVGQNSYQNRRNRNRNRVPLIADQQGAKLSFNTRFTQINKQIDDATAARTISRSQSSTLKSGLKQLSNDVDQDFNSKGGFTQDEVNSLNARLATFSQHVTTSIQVSANTNNGHNGRRNNRNRYGSDRPLSWDQERNAYRSNWNKLTPGQRSTLQANMNSQWNAYHRSDSRWNQTGANRWNTKAAGTWNQNASWNDYSDPGFLDYLHNSSPTLLTQIRSYLGL